MPHQHTFACPNCDIAVQTGAPACTRCGIRLTGHEVRRLWEVDQDIAALTAERTHLIAALTAPATSGSRPAAAPISGIPSASPYARTPGPRRSVSGQQLLLGLGALLLLSAASFFLLVVWLVVGLVGQALIMLTLTGTAVAGSRWATRRGLPAAAETAAVIATGLLLIDLSAAHALGLAGLDAVPWSTYWTGACILGAAVLIGWDTLIPRQHQGRALRRILTYRPAAAFMVATTPWFLLAALAPAPHWMPAALGLVALTNVACAVAAARLDVPPAPVTTPPAIPATDTLPAPVPARRLTAALPVSTGVLGLAAVLALTAHAVTGLSLGFDLAAPQSQRYTAFASLTVLPILLACLTLHRVVRAAPPAVVSRLPVVATGWAAAALGIPLMDATYPLLVALSVLAALLAAGLHLRQPAPSTAAARAWLRVGAAFVFIAQPVLLTLVLIVTHSGHDSLHTTATFTGIAVAGLAPLLEPSPVWSVLAAAAWVLSSTIGAVCRRSAGWAFAAHIGIVVAVAAALENSTSRVAWLVLLGVFAACTALACVSARRTEFIATIDSLRPRRADDREAGTPLVGGSPFWSGVERATVFFAVLYAFGALVAAAATSSAHVSVVFVFVGVLTLTYAASPRRLSFSYVGSLVISAGTANLSQDASITLVEAYTAPLVVLLAAIGYVQWRRNPHAPTGLTMGPALAVAFGPSLLSSLDEGDEVRLAVVTMAAVAALLIGLTRHWKAPVTSGALALVVIAVTQGGPLTAYVPGWVTLGAAGAALLAAGIAWERAVLAGRRAATWYATLA